MKYSSNNVRMIKIDKDLLKMTFIIWSTQSMTDTTLRVSLGSTLHKWIRVNLLYNMCLQSLCDGVCSTCEKRTRDLGTDLPISPFFFSRPAFSKLFDILIELF